MLGAIFGDIAGSAYEWNNVKRKDFPWFPEKSRCTDDSVMTVALALAFLTLEDEFPLEHFRENVVLAMRMLGQRHPRAGYGGKFALWLFSRNPKPYYSFGNGSAMRVSPVAWAARDLNAALRLARISAEVTHNHPEGIKGAEVVAGAIFLARKGATKEEIRAFAAQYYDLGFTLDEIRPTYRFDVTCQGSVPQAIVAFLESESFEDAIRGAISIGGDSDTLAAIAGSIAEAFYGMTDGEKAKALSYLPEDLLPIVEDFTARFCAGEEA